MTIQWLVEATFFFSAENDKKLYGPCEILDMFAGLRQIALHT